MSINTFLVITCPICGSQGEILYQGLKDRIYQIPGVWSFFQCLECKTIWLNPRPDIQEFQKLYEIYYTHSNDTFTIPSKEEITEKFKNLLLPGRYDEINHLDTFFLSKVNNGKLLDIGCGNGVFLARMREKGWDVTGLEADAKAAFIAESRYGLKVIVGRWEEVDFLPNSFDAIIMNHVIEHMTDPGYSLKRCFDVLKIGGELSLVTPNIESLGHKIFRKYWYSLDPPRHLILFSKKNLKELFKDLGFSDLNFYSFSRSTRYIVDQSMKIFLGGHVTDTRFNKNTIICFNKILGLSLISLEYWGNAIFNNIGEELVIVAKR